MNFRLRDVLGKLRQLAGAARTRHDSIDTPHELDPAMLPKLLRKSDPVILDIGCNDGQHTLEFLRVFRNPTVFCFEPDARAQRAFRNNVTSPRAQLFEMALGNADGMVDFNVSAGTPPAELGFEKSDWDLSGSIRRPKNHLEVVPWVSFDKVVPVRIARLDTWARENKIGAVDFIWADVQGAEVDLIEGGRETLRNTRYLYTEYSDYEMYEGQMNLRGITHLLPDFEVVSVYPSDVLLRNKALHA